MSSKLRLILGALIVVLIFFAVTFSKNWGTAKSENLLSKFKLRVSELEKKPSQARIECVAITKKLEQSIDDLKKSQEKNQDLLAYKLIADCNFAAKNYEKSVDFYKKLSEAEPQVAKWHHRVAESYFHSEKFSDALPMSILATQLEPKNFKVWLLNARILSKLHLNNRSITAYYQAIKLAPYELLEHTKQELLQVQSLNIVKSVTR